MPLETPGFLSQLVPTNPAHSDQLNQADSHLRLIKQALLNTFPSWTNVALNSSQAQIDAAVTATSNGTAVLADAGAFFRTNTHDGFSNPSLGEIDVILNNILAIKLKSDGSVAAAKFVGAGVVPIGGSMMWFEDALPNAVYGDYAWLNGQVITGAATRCPELYARWLHTFGGTGVDMGVPDTTEAAPYGKSTMGGRSSPGRITNYVLTTLGNIIGAGFATAPLPVHNHTISGTTGDDSPDHTHGFVANIGGGASYTQGGSSAGNNGGGNTAGANNRHQHGVGTLAIANAGAGGAHDNVSPGFVCNWVVRLA